MKPPPLVPERSIASDAELVWQSQAGSLAAFEQLVYRYEHRVHAFVTQLCRNPTDARELTQDTFVKASQSIIQFDSRREFAPWLFTIARHKSVDRLRAAPPVSEVPLPETVDEANPGELLAEQEDRQQLWQLARRNLTEFQFQALWFRYAEDMDVAQIAQALGKSRVHVKVLLFRARQILARHLSPARSTSQANSKPQPTPPKVVRSRANTAAAAAAK